MQECTYCQSKIDKENEKSKNTLGTQNAASFLMSSYNSREVETLGNISCEIVFHIILWQLINKSCHSKVIQLMDQS